MTSTDWSTVPLEWHLAVVSGQIWATLLECRCWSDSSGASSRPCNTSFPYWDSQSYVSHTVMLHSQYHGSWWCCRCWHSGLQQFTRSCDLGPVSIIRLCSTHCISHCKYKMVMRLLKRRSKDLSDYYRDDQIMVMVTLNNTTIFVLSCVIPLEW